MSYIRSITAETPCDLCDARWCERGAGCVEDYCESCELAENDFENCPHKGNAYACWKERRDEARAERAIDRLEEERIYGRLD